MAVRQAVDVHVSNPLVSHHAGGVPAIDDTVIAIPKHRSSESMPWDPGTYEMVSKGLAPLKLPFLHVYVLLLPVESFLRTPQPLL